MTDPAQPWSQGDAINPHPYANQKRYWPRLPKWAENKYWYHDSAPYNADMPGQVIPLAPDEVANLIGDWDPSDESTLTLVSGVVSVMTGAVGSDMTANSGRRPPRAAINGRGALLFNGTNQVMRAVITQHTTANKPFTVLVPMSVRTQPGGEAFAVTFNSTSTAPFRGARFPSSGALMFRSRDNNNDIVDTSGTLAANAFPTGENHVFGLRFDGTTVEFWMDGVMVFQEAHASADVLWANRLTIGGWWQVTSSYFSFLNAAYGRVIYYDDAVTDNEMEGLSLGLAAVWTDAQEAVAANAVTQLASPTTFAASGLSDWPVASCSLSFGQSGDPAAGSAAALMLESSGSSVHGCYHRSGGITTTASAQYEASIYVKPNGRTKCRLSWNDGAVANGVFATFDLTAGTILSNAAAIASGVPVVDSAVIYDAGGGWWRIGLAGAVASTTTYLTVETLNDAADRSFAGDTSKGLYLYGAQVKLGPVVTGPDL